MRKFSARERFLAGLLVLAMGIVGIMLVNPSPRERNTIVMVGDSITAGGSWKENFPDVRILNRGISGNRTYDVLNRIPMIASTGARTVFIMIGINDLLHGRPVSDTFETYQRIVEELKGYGITPILQSVLPCHPKITQRYGVDVPDANAKVAQLNTLVREYAQAQQVQYIDLLPAMTADGFLIESFTHDGLHLTAEGYARWYDAIANDVARASGE